MSSPGEPQLRSVPRPASPPPRGSRGDRALSIALGLALAVALVLLIWSRSESGARISDLEAQNAGLREQLAAREALVRSQQQRLADVRTGVHGLVELLDAPLGTPAPRP